MNLSLYFHIPFCEKRCNYCDFNTTTGKSTLIPDYIGALSKEIKYFKQFCDEYHVHSVYFGGGTPSLIPISRYETLFAIIESNFHLTDDCEISLEANPGTLSVDYVSGLKALGFNRVSLGVQSTQSYDLQRLGRIHDVNEILSSFAILRKAGFNNINLDMIFGLPWQDLSSWENSLQRALILKPEHFSLYSLIIEPGTKLYEWYQKGWVNLQDQDLEGDMYELAMDTLSQEGFEQYEISNWARKSSKKDYRSRHNLQYWLNAPYLGFGAGAHGYFHNIRTENEPDLEKYIARLFASSTCGLDFPQSSGTVRTEKVDKSTQMKDFMWLGLRLIQEGASKNRFMDWYGESMEDVFMDEITYLINQGLVAWDSASKNNLRLTKGGILVANQVFMQFV